MLQNFYDVAMLCDTGKLPVEKLNGVDCYPFVKLSDGWYFWADNFFMVSGPYSDFLSAKESLAEFENLNN